MPYDKAQYAIQQFYRDTFAVRSVADPSTTADDDAARAKRFLEQLPAVPGAVGGHGGASGTSITGFPPWFRDLQRTLNRSTRWTRTHEEAHRHLYAVGISCVAALIKPTPIAPWIDYYLRFLGKCQGALESTRTSRYRVLPPGVNPMLVPDLEHAGDPVTDSGGLGGEGGNGLWCGPAATNSLDGGLAESRLRTRFAGGPQATWAMKLDRVKGAPAMIKRTGGTSPYRTPRHGDYVIMVGDGTPLSGHVGAVIWSETFSDATLPDDKAIVKMIFASGNSYGEKGGVNIDEGHFGRLPPDYDYYEIISKYEPTRNRLEKEKVAAATIDTSSDDPNAVLCVTTQEQKEQIIAANAKEKAAFDAKYGRRKLCPGKGEPSWLVTIVDSSRLDAKVLRASEADRAKPEFDAKLAEWMLERWDPFAPPSAKK